MDLPLFADIIIPAAVEGAFTYLVKESQSDGIRVGSRVVVEFGRKRLFTGVVILLHNHRPPVDKIKEVVEVTGDTINEHQLMLWRWMSEYYLCTPGEVMNSAMPAGMKVESRTVISLPGEITDTKRFDSSAAIILEILGKEGSISLDKLPVTIDGESVLKIVSRLVDKGVVVAGEKAIERYSPREEQYISLAKDHDEESLNRLLDSLTKTPARQRLVNTYLEITGYEGNTSLPAVKKSLLLSSSGISAGPLTELVKKGVLKKVVESRGRIREWRGNIVEPNTLSIDQLRALSDITGFLEANRVTLLRGVTSSGKTEIYIHLIKQEIERGKQVLFLLPEIAITTQMINRLKRHFGDSVGVYHSGFSDNERVEVWRRTAATGDDKMYRVILGVRSSIFLPFHSLGLVIVDEEHDNSYKQQDPAPRYNARDSAIMLAHFHNAKTLLGSATPSIESVYNARKGKYGYTEMNERFGEVKMPQMILSDTRDAYRRKQMVSHFTPQMISAIEEALEKKEQVVLFRNRRGYAPVIQCRECGWMPGCKSCSVNLTYHRAIGRMKCHYCGYSTAVPSKCPSCGSGDLVLKGFGTEKLEDELGILFPEARVDRMDLDTTRKKGSFDRIIGDLEAGKTDILIGTQMISKGLDFENLTVVGILNIDNMLYFPDFRSHEKCFQMIEQVSGRAGRRSKQGKVIVQTFDPTHPVMVQAISHNFNGMVESQLIERKEFSYPPFTRLIKLYVRHRDRRIATEGAADLAKRLRVSFGNRILGPEPPVMSRVQSYFIMAIIIKLESNRGTRKAKERVSEIIREVRESALWPGLKIHADVDPV